MRLLFTATILSLCALAPPTRAEDILVNVDFDGPSVDLHVKQKGSFDGPLPVGMELDFPGWNTSVVRAEKIAGDGKSFIRFNVDKLDQAALLRVVAPLPPGAYDLDAYYRFEVEFKSHEVVRLYTRICTAPWSDVCGIRARPDKGPEAWTRCSIPVRSTKWSLGEADWGKPVGLFMELPVGVTEIARVKLVRLTPEEMSASLNRPDASCRNFLRNSRFPLGLQAGWNLDREFTAGSVESDDRAPGSSGVASLKIDFPAKSKLHSEPFQTSNPFTTNHVSLSYMAKGSWKVQVVKEDESEYPFVVRDLKATSNAWTTVTVDFKPDMVANRFHIAFEGEGTLHIDSLRVWAGDPREGYVSAGECEVALALPHSEISQTRIQFDSEPAKLRYCVTGDFKGAVLKSKVVTAYGDEKPLPDVRLTASSGELDFAVFPEKPYGQFRIEVWAERGGKRISPFNEALVTRIRKPHFWGKDAPPDSPFGCHLLASPLMIPTVKAAGVNWVRLHDAGVSYIGWYFLEQEKGKWTFHDADLLRYRDGKLGIFGTLQTTPQWAAKCKNSPRDFFGKYSQPENLDDWANYVKAVCARYKGVIAGYYIWNEPWGNDFWYAGYDPVSKLHVPGKSPAADYARLSEVTYKVAKATDPDIRISGFNAAGWCPKWTTDLMAAGSAEFCDLADFHVYGDGVEENFHKALDPLCKSGFKKPIHMSEGQAIDYSNTSNSGLYNHTLTWPVPKPDANIAPADAECRFVIRLLALGCERINLYSAHGYTGLGSSGFRTLVCGDGYPLPVLAAYSNMAWLLEGRKFVRNVPLGGEVVATLFEGRDGAVAVLSSSKTGRYVLPKSRQLSVMDLFGNPLKGRIEYQGRLIYVDSRLSADKLQAILLSQ